MSSKAGCLRLRVPPICQTLQRLPRILGKPHRSVARDSKIIVTAVERRYDTRCPEEREQRVSRIDVRCPKLRIEQ